MRMTDHFRKIETPLLTLLLAIGMTGSAQAERDDTSYSDRGFYVGVGGLYTHNLFEDEIDDALEDGVGTDADVAVDDSWGVNARVGYRAASWFAVEAHYEYVDGFDVRGSIEGLFANEKMFSLSGHTLTANTRFIVPVWRTQPYFLLGAGLSLYESEVSSIAQPVIGLGGNESGFAARAGGGMDFYLTSNVVLNTEASVLVTTQDFSRPDVDHIDELWYLSVGAGLRYQF